QDLERDLLPIEPSRQPFEAVAAMLAGQLRHFGCLLGRGSSIWLDRWRKIFGPCLQQSFSCSRSQQLDCSLIAVDEPPRLRIKEPNRIRAPLEQTLKHGLILSENRAWRTGPIGPFTVRRRRINHERIMKTDYLTSGAKSQSSACFPQMRPGLRRQLAPARAT